MESWPKDLFNFIEQAAQEAEAFFWELTDSFESIMVEFDQSLGGALEPLVEMILGLEATVGETTQPLTQTLHPVFQEHPACVGCRHYHGQVYGEALLVCGMHPYGYDGVTCPDWESTWDRLA